MNYSWCLLQSTVGTEYQLLRKRALFIPFLTTAVAMAWVWRWFYQPMPIGYFNIILSWGGIPQQPFLRSVEQALYSVMAPAVWAGLGFQIVIFIAGLRAIPKSHFEAAEIDGAGRIQILKEIILPALKPTSRCAERYAIRPMSRAIPQ